MRKSCRDLKKCQPLGLDRRSASLKLKKFLRHGMQDHEAKTPRRDPPRCLEKDEASDQVEITYEDSQLERVKVLPPQDVEQHP